MNACQRYSLLAIAWLLLSPRTLSGQEPARGLSAEAVEQYAGIYASPEGGTLAISTQLTPFGVFPLLSVVPSGALRILFPVARDTFVSGTELTKPDPAEQRIVFRRGSGGAITAVELSDSRGLQQPRIAPRRELRREPFVVRRDSLRLPGELFLPRNGRKRVPAVVLVAGSEDSDRHSFGALPFVLANRGIAALAIDKRGTGKAGGSWKSSGIEELALDVAAAVAELRQHPAIDPDRVCIIGFSEGGWVAPRAAAEGGVACIVAISGGGRTKGDAFIYKNRRIAQEQGLSGSALESAVTDAESTIRESQARVSAQRGSGFDRRVTYDPADDWRAYRGPVLVLFGAEDVLDDAGASSEWLRDVFAAAKHPDYTVRVFPGAHHGILIGAEPLPSAFARLHGVRGFAPGYWDTLLGWLDSRLLQGEGSQRPLGRSHGLVG